MNAADFILIQVNPDDKYYELARIRPYFDDDYEWDKERGWYCEGFSQNNGSIGEFSLHLGHTESDIREKFIFIGYPVKEGYYGQKIQVKQMAQPKQTTIK